MNIKNDEQWLLDGICDNCRKQTYCSKPCTKNKTKQQLEFKQLIREKSGLNKAFECLKGIK